MSSCASSATASEGATMDTKLQETLSEWSITVPKNTLTQLRDNGGWIRETVRVKELKGVDLYGIFSFEHHVSSAIELFNKAKGKMRFVSVVHGHKHQGKSQFLFFLVRLLQELGEVVVYLDKTVLPTSESDACDTAITDLWSDAGLSANCKAALKSFRDKKSLADFRYLIQQLRKFAQSRRVWVIVDEVVEFQNASFPINLPEEQTESPFHWIVTGSAGIGKLVSKQHLEKYIFDLPLFSDSECLEFATKLCKSFGIDLSESIGIPSDGVSEWLEERFGGVIGYVAELILKLSSNAPVSNYMLALSERVEKVIVNTAKRQHISVRQLSGDWLNEMKSPNNTWHLVRDSGLCGSGPPRGVIFSTMLEWLCTYYSEEDSLSLVHRFRQQYSDDPGLDGCLLELEEILKLKGGQSFEAAALVFNKNKGIWASQETLCLPEPPKTRLNLFRYEEHGNQGRLVQEKTAVQSKCHLIELKSGFDVVDVVLVDHRSEAPIIYGVQITRSKDPFTNHHTLDTCPDRSKERLKQLWQVISSFWGFQNHKISYVMIAPNCERDKYKPRAGHEEPYYFSPARVVDDYRPAEPKKRATTNISAQPRKRPATGDKLKKKS